MAAVELQFELKEGRYVSSPIEVTSPNICVQIEFERSGDVMLQTSATGENYADFSFMGNYGAKQKIIVTNITGGVVGMFLRLQFTGMAKPSKIFILQ